MRISKSILLGIAALLPTSVQAAPVTEENREDSGNGNICTSEVVIDCTFIENGVELSCISDEPATAGASVPPFLFVPAANCDENIQATVTFKMCNRNDNANNEAIQLRNDRSYYTIKGENTYVGFNLSPGQCETITRQVEYPKCKVFPLYVQMDGFMPRLNENNTKKAYCYAKAFRKNKSKKITSIPGGQVYTETCSETSEYESGQGYPAGENVCNTSVSLQCSFEDENGASQSCIGPDKEFVFTSVREDLCADKKIYPTITYTLCNNNAQNSRKTFTNTMNVGKTSYFKWNNANLDVPAIRGMTPFAPQQCESYTFEPEIDTCKKNWPLSVKLEGNMRDSPSDVVVPGTNSFCYCFLYKKAIVMKYAKPPNPPNPPPVAPPTPPPVPPPTPACNFSDVIITELGSPNDSSARYVEVFFKDCAPIAPTTITEDIRIISNNRVFSLQGRRLPPSGIIVVCVNKNGHRAFFNFSGFESCDFEDNVANNDGTEPVTVNKGATQVLDIFKPEPVIPFTNGKAMRIKPNTQNPSQVYNPSQWIILPGTVPPTPIGIGNGEVDQPKGYDPGVWYTPLVISAIIDEPADDSQPGKQPRYINIKSPYGGGTIIDNLYLVIFNENSGEPDFNSAVPLSNLNPGPLNEIRVCNHDVEDKSKCDSVSDQNSPLPGIQGCYTVGIILWLPGNYNYHIVDLYGRRGVQCAGTEFDFEGGTAVREPAGEIPVSIWNPIQWIINTPEEAILIITEVTDPSENLSKYRFVELYSPNRKNYEFQVSDNLYLVTYPDNNASPRYELSLAGKRTDANGLVVFCTSDEYYAQRCNYVEGTSSVADTPGISTVQIVKKTSNSNTVVDVYGGVGLTGAYRDFTSGRVNRKDTNGGSTIFNINDWDFFKPASAQTTDPGCWNSIGNCVPLPPIISDNLILFITEVSDPTTQDAPNTRFIELYSPNKPNHVVGNWSLQIVGNNGGSSTIPLTGYVTDSYGFIVICKSKSGFARCNEEQNMVNNPGTEVVYLKKGANIIDSYGTTATNNWYFVDGRANRKFDGPAATFDRTHWEIYSPADFEPSDPGCWNGIGSCSLPPVPAPSPPSAPSKGGKGKGKGSKTRRRLRNNKRV